jgi:CheY-like chemotaxis protein
VLVLDVNLPGISGVELLTLLRQDSHWNEPPIILMSADAGQPAVRDALRDSSVTTFIEKPFDVDQLVGEIEKAVAARERGPGPSV